MAISSVINKIFGAFGYSLIPKWRLERHEFSSFVRRVFCDCGIDCVYDIGANRGQYHDFLRYEVGFDGPIFSFEPVADLYNKLQDRSRKDPLWHVFPFALGSVTGERVINVMASDDFSSFCAPSDNHISDFVDSNKILKKESVRVRRFEDVFGEINEHYGFSHPYMKIDTQGFDLEVIRGAGNSLADIAVIQCEVSVIPIYIGMPDYINTLSTLKNLGFDLAGLFSVTRDARLRVIEFDSISINTKKKLR